MNTVFVHDEPPELLAQALVTRFEALPAAAVSDAMQRDPGVTGLRLMSAGCVGTQRKSMAGLAVTVRTRPGDNLALHVALDLARPGEVIVVDGGGELRNALLGELIVTYAMRRGIAGIVVDGAIRDSEQLLQLPLPVYARGVSHRGPYKSGPGWVNPPVSVGGTVVCRGDVIVGDADGVVSVSADRAAIVAERAESIVGSELAQQELIDGGDWDRSWIAETTDVVRAPSVSGAKH